MKQYYQSKKKSVNSPTRTVPSPKFSKTLGGSTSPTERDQRLADVGGAAGANMLRNYASKAGAEESKSLETEETETFTELDFDDNIQYVAEGFQKNQDHIDKLRERQNEPGSPKMSAAVRLPNQGAATSMLRTAAQNERRERFKSPSRILSGQDSDDDNDPDAVTHEGQMYRESGERKLKGYWYKLRNKDLYYYKKESDDKQKGMYTLSNVFIKAEEPEAYDDDGSMVYSFTLIFASKERRFYSLEKEAHDIWMDKLMAAIGYSNILTYYDIGESIGKGKFGRVKAGVHKKTGKQVAIKILKKKKMDPEDFELYKREVEILKICQHPNII